MVTKIWEMGVPGPRLWRRICGGNRRPARHLLREEPFASAECRPRNLGGLDASELNYMRRASSVAAEFRCKWQCCSVTKHIYDAHICCGTIEAAEQVLGRASTQHSEPHRRGLQ